MKIKFGRHRISLRQKAVASVFLTFALLTFYVFYFTTVEDHHRAEEGIIKAAQVTAGLISVASSAATLNENETYLNRILKHALRNRDMEYIRFVNRGGDILAEGGLQKGYVFNREKGSPTIQEIGEPEGLFHNSGHIFNIRMPILHEGEDVGEIYMEINTVEVNRELAWTFLRRLTIFIMTIISGSLLIYFMERRMRGSLKKLIKTTGQMAEGDLSQRVEIEIGDEVEELGESFNRMAQALSGKEKELLKAKNTMISIFNGITAGIAYVSEDYLVSQANQAYEDLLRDITGSSLTDEHKCFDLFLQERNICKDCPGKAAMVTGKHNHLEIEITLKDGERCALWIHAYPVQGPDQNPVGFVEYILDITQQRELEDELKIYTEHLEEITQEQTRKLKEAQVQIVHQERMAALGQMVTGVAHEINNPNSFISYNIPLLEETWRMFEPIVSEYATAYRDKRISGLSIEELSGEMRDLIQDIKVGSDRINKIVSGLKDFARFDESFQIKPVHVNEMIEKTMAIVGAQAKKAVGRVSMDLAPNLPTIQGHTQKLEQVMANLVMNSVKAIPDKDKGRLSVTTRYLERLATVLIEVEDNGKGMESEVIDRIFEPFFTTRRNMGGTGLGLSVSYSLIKEHNGNIGVLSRPSLGTRFTVYLPVDGEKKPELRPSILCLDDDNEFPDLLNSHFTDVEKLSHETGNNPESVVEYLLKHPEIDIVLLDVMIPGLKSWKLIEKIKGRFPLLTVIVYSNDLDALGKKPDNAPTPDYFLHKPFKLEKVIEIINGIDRQRL
jgi:signal transduction histidine kinase